MKSYKRILSVLLVAALLFVSLPMSFVSAAATVPAISDAEYAVGREIWSFDPATADKVPESWKTGLTDDAWANSNYSITTQYLSDKKAVRVSSSDCDGILRFPTIYGDANNFVYEVKFTVSANAFGLANNITETSKEGYIGGGATWTAVYANSTNSPYRIRKGDNGFGNTKYVTAISPAGGNATTHTLKTVVLNGYTYTYLNGTLLECAADAEGFKDTKTTENINIGLYLCNSVVDIYSVKVSSIGEVDVWNGSFDGVLPTADADGNGEIEITTPEEFAAVAASTGLDSDGNRIKYELISDIYLNNVLDANWQTSSPNEWLAPVSAGDVNAKAFRGIINGNGYVVRGMYINYNENKTNSDRTAYADSQATEGTEVVVTDNIYAGLFPVIGKGAGLVGIGVEDAYISMTDNCTPVTAGGKQYVMNRIGTAGALVGAIADVGTENAIIDMCYADDSVVMTAGRAGFIGKCDLTSSAIITNCYSYCNADVFTGTASENNNGNRYMFAASNTHVTIGSCYTLGNMANAGDFTKNIAAGKDYINTYMFTNAKNSAWGWNTYSTNVGSYTAIQGESAKYTMPNLDWDKFVTTDTYPTLKIFLTHKLANVNNLWDGNEDATATDSNGDGYVEVTNAGQLAYVIKHNVKARLMNDIYINDISVYAKGAFYVNHMDHAAKTWLNSVNYSSELDGNGHIVYGLFYDTAPTKADHIPYGLVPKLGGGGIVRRIGIEQAYMRNNSNYSMGAVVGTISNYGADVSTIDRCYVGETAFIHGVNGVGGITGGGSNANCYKVITNCYSLATIKYSKKHGGIVGDQWNAGTYTVKYCYTNASSLIDQDWITVTAKGNYNIGAADNGSTGVKSTASMMGADALKNMPELNGAFAYVTTMGYPILKIFSKDYVAPTKEEITDGFEVIKTNTVAASGTVSTENYIFKAVYTLGEDDVTVTNNNGGTTYVIKPDGTVSVYLTADAENAIVANVVLENSVTVEVMHINGADTLFVNDEYIATLTSPEIEGNDTVTCNAANYSGAVELLLPVATFDGVTVSDIKLQYKDLLGNSTPGSNGFKFNVTLTSSDVIEAMGYTVEYGAIIAHSNSIDENITLNTAPGVVLKTGANTFEYIGVSKVAQEQFYAVRGYAKITIDSENDYYYYCEDTTVFSPVYEANKAYDDASDAVKSALGAIYGDSDKFVTNLTGTLDFTVFADYHYKTGMYTSQISDLEAIIERANTNNSSFIFSMGDLSNDMKGSPEVTNTLLNNKYAINYFNIYGNHELESANTMEYVNTTLANTNVHWGDGSVGKVAADGYTSYYYFDVNGIRVIAVNTNYSWNPNHKNGVVIGWEHNLTGSYGPPTADTNKNRGFDEGSNAAANIYGNSLGDVQLKWLEETLMDAVEQGTPCVVMGHDSFSGKFGGSSDSAKVRALYAKANAIRKGTVLASLNGHLHTNRQAVVEDVLYLDINTVRNNWWQGNYEAHYTDEHTFTLYNYDNEGNLVSSETKKLKDLGMGSNTWFSADPLSCNIKVTQSGQITVSGMRSSWMYDIAPSSYPGYAYPEITSGKWTLGESTFTNTETPVIGQ